MKIRIILKTERRFHVDGPIITDHEIIEVEAPEVAQRVRNGGYNEDGTFELTQIVGVEVPRTTSQ
ncbi:hypothetical protein [Bradyrhizobium sp. 87]|uniref:hypothetical protein n=1 Tax=Bradyrhizobium sp. 87 TaxID=2782682 RepID=UPI001FF7C9E7|nr:hypothetical protein [Bradyrhizobium sp. 87]MCK1430927.1 hypothetical protein [Bradyrhizobium sp. 87]